MTWRVYIVDDEPHIRSELRYVLQKLPEIQVVGEADNAFDALGDIQQLCPDIVFLDIQLGDIDGITLSKKLRQTGVKTMFIIVSAHSDYAEASYEIDACGYVLKPFSEERLISAVQRATGRLSVAADPQEGPPAKGESGRLAAKQNDSWKLLNMEDVCFFYSQDHAVYAETQGGVYKLNVTLRQLESQLPPGQYVRTHKSFIVNIRHIDEVIPWFNCTYKVTVKNKSSEIPVSRNYFKAFKQRLALT